MKYKLETINIGPGQTYPTEVLVYALKSDRGMGDDEWNRKMRFLLHAAARTKDDVLLDDLEEVMKKRDGIGFPKVVATTPNNIPEAGSGEKQNYFAPRKHLQEMLCREWFDGVCVDSRMYDRTWRELLIENLMNSEHKDYIESQWRSRNSYYVRARVLGLLKEAGVIKGSMDSIARSAGVCDNYRTFSKYMGQCRQEPYAEWVLEYIESHR